LWRAGIFDQHFLQRQRHNRLLSAVLDHPQMIGVGIDEATAVIVRGRTLEVVGQSAVVDPRCAAREGRIRSGWRRGRGERRRHLGAAGGNDLRFRPVITDQR
jgi:cyanophycinase-like exopeptidase